MSSKEKKSNQINYRNIFWVSAIVLFSAIVQLFNISRSSIWHDEGFSLMLIEFGWSEMIQRAILDVHPPLYYIFLKPWVAVFGNSELAARSMSVVFSLGLIVVTYLLIKRLFNFEMARLAAFFVGVGPFMVRYAQEARMYTLGAFLLMLSTYLLVRLIEDSKHINNKWWFGYGALIAAAMYTHYYAMFVIPVHWVYIAIVHYRKKRSNQDWPRWLKLYISRIEIGWWKAYALAFGLFLPWLPVAYKQFTQVQSGFWIPEVGHNTLYSTLTNFLVFRDPWMLNPWLNTAVLVISITVIASLVSAYKSASKKKKKHLTLLLLYVTLSPAIVYLISHPPLQPIYTDRYFSLTVAGFYALLGVIFYLKPLKNQPKKQIALFVILLMSFGYGLYNVYTWGDFKMRELSQRVESSSTLGDEYISTDLYSYFDVRYYSDDPEEVQLLVPEHFSVYGNQSLVFDNEEILVHDLENYQPEFGVVWLIGQKENDKLTDVPDTWYLMDSVEEGYAAAYKYFVAPTYTDQSVTISR